MKHRIKKLMAYIYMPLIFTILGYSFAYIALSPVLEMLQAVGSMVIAQEVPDFNSDLKSIYNPSGSTDSSTTQGDSLDPSGLDKNIVSMDTIEFPDYETHFANLVCERIGLDAPIYWGDSTAILKAGAGQFMGSFMPGFNRSMLVSGHNTTYFKPLKDIATGDVIIYDTNYGRFEYEVAEVKVMDENEAANIRNEMLSYKEEKLILYTCYPFETLVGRKTDRLFVFANKISGPTVE